MFDRERNEFSLSNESFVTSSNTNSTESQASNAVEATVWNTPEFEDVTACAEIGAYAFLA